MKHILSRLQNSLPARQRSLQGGSRTLALACALALGGITPVLAQEEEQPAWERIADKVTPNSLEESGMEESGPEELPTVILDDGAQYDVGDMEAETPSAESGEMEMVEGDGSDSEAPAQEEGAQGEAQGSRMDASAPGTIGLPQAGGKKRGGDANINLGKESQDDGVVANLFDDPEVLRMLGANPRFVYGALRSPDPMIFPPVRNAAIYAELSLEAERLIKQGKLAEAQQNYKRILDLNDKRYALEMRNKIAQLNNRMGAARMVLTEDQFIDVKLPQWVRVNSRGILYDETDPMVLVGDYTLHIGDAIPSHPEVRVEAIDKRTVTYRVSDRESFNVAVKGFQ